MEDSFLTKESYDSMKKKYEEMVERQQYMKNLFIHCSESMYGITVYMTRNLGTIG